MEQTFSENEYTYCSNEQSIADCAINTVSSVAAIENIQVGGRQLEYIPENIEEEELNEAENQNAIAGNDMFFSCCDWEALRQAEKQDTDDSQNSHAENFSDSDDEILNKISFGHQSPKECKRKSKASRKFGNFIDAIDQKFQENFDEFDVDLVMKRIPCPNDSERIVSTRRYFSKSRRTTNDRKMSKNSQTKKTSGVSDQLKLNG